MTQGPLLHLFGTLGAGEDEPERPRPPRATHFTVNLRAGCVIVAFPYSRELTTAVKALHGRRYDPPTRTWQWSAPSTHLLLSLEGMGALLDDAARLWLDEHAPQDGRRQPRQMTPVNLPDNYPWLAKTSGREHQRKASAWRRGHAPDGVLHPTGAFEMGMGTGKTLTIIEEVHKLRAAQPGAKVLVLCPNAVMRLVWRDQFALHSSIRFRVKLLDGPISRRKLALEREWDDYDVFVHNHESLSDMGRTLAALPWTMLVIDEHSKFRKHTSMRAKLLLGHGKFIGRPLRASYEIAMSGTPAIKAATDVYATYKWLGCPVGNIAEFRERYCIMGGFENHQAVGLKPDSGLHELLDGYRFVIPKDCVIKLPRAWHPREVTLPDWQRVIYNRVRNEMRVAFTGAAHDRDGNPIEGEHSANLTNHLTVLLRLQEVVSGVESTGDAYKWHPANAKAQYLTGELLPDIFTEDGDAKVIIWCWFKHEIRHLAATLAAITVEGEHPYRPVTFSGDDGPKAKEDAVAAFRTGPANIFVGQASAGGLGLNLPEAQTMIWYTRGYGQTEAWLQALDRNSRLDTEHTNLNVFVLEAADTVDQQVTDALVRDCVLAGRFTSIDPVAVLHVDPHSPRPSARQVALQALGLPYEDQP